jgi:putative transposase
MPRGPRLDAPGALHHIMVRGIERRNLFTDAVDRQAWVDRLATVATATELTVLAWALLPNHAHLLVRTGRIPLATGMRRLLTGYAGGFNRRHTRSGRLFQNRYKSILVEEEPYLLELVRYIHLNPLRARQVSTLVALDRYAWSGRHSALVGRVPRPWQAVTEVLTYFGGRAGVARRRYRAYVAAGIPQGRRPDLGGGGLRRSVGGWTVVERLRRGRELGAADERILGSGAFVEAVHREAAACEPPARARALAALPGLIARCAAAWQIRPAELAAGSRRRSVAAARAVIGYLGVQELGLPLTELAHHLGVTPVAVQHGLCRAPAALAAHGSQASVLLGWAKGKVQ